MKNVVNVKLWDKKAGEIKWNDELRSSYFIYDKDYLKNGFELSPFLLSFDKANIPVKSDPSMEHVFKNLPPVFADSLPDDFGNSILKAYLTKTNKQLNPVEKLLFIGKCGMGALEYEPAFKIQRSDESLNMEDIVKITSEILSNKKDVNFKKISEESFLKMLRVGIFAGGARTKIIVAINNDTKEIKAGDIIHKGNYSYWIAKLDKVEGNNTMDPKSYTKIEYAYYKMAKAAGIKMSDSFLYSEGGRNHFFTKRFDRTEKGEKLHMLSLTGLRGYNFKNPVEYSYEDIFDTIRELQLPYEALEQQYIRALFNIIARNQDDHVKNISFLMDKTGRWSLSPAYDITYSYNPDGFWTRNHQLSLNGKINNFTRSDLLDFGRQQGIINPKQYLEKVTYGVSRWKEIAKELDIPEQQIEAISKVQRINIGMNNKRNLQI